MSAPMCEVWTDGTAQCTSVCEEPAALRALHQFQWLRLGAVGIEPPASMIPGFAARRIERTSAVRVASTTGSPGSASADQSGAADAANAGSAFLNRLMPTYA